MTAKSQTRVSPNLLSNRQYSGTMATFLYNWPIFAGMSFLGLVLAVGGAWLGGWYSLIAIGSGVLLLLYLVNILVGAFIVYDWGQQREYDRLAELGRLDQANVVIDVTAGKLRGTRGMLSRVEQGHYFVIDIYDPEKMPDEALRRAREMEPPLEADRRIYRRTARPNSLPIPHNWADAVYCSFSLHELQDPADRAAIFAEFARILKPTGKLLIAEHSRDWPSWLVWGPGVLSYLSPAAWEKHLTQAGFVTQQHERWRGLAHLWVAEKKPR